MERGCNNDAIRKWGFETPGQAFFYQRWSELMHGYTLDSYQVNVLSPRGSLVEMLSVLDAMDDHPLADANFIDVMDESTLLLKSDPVLERHFRNRKNSLLASMSKSKAQRKSRAERLSLKYRIAGFLDDTRSQYLEWVLGDLAQSIGNDDLNGSDRLVRILGSEALGLGWSQKALYELKWQMQAGGSFDGVWRLIQGALLRPAARHRCLVPIPNVPPLDPRTVESLRRLGLTIVTGQNLETELAGINLFPALVSADRLFSICVVDAYDPYSAALSAVQQVSDRVGTLAFYGYIRPWAVHTQQVIVVDEARRRTIEIDLPELLIPSAGLDVSLRSAAPLERIFSATGMEAVKPKLVGTFTYNALSMLAASQEIRFLNLWASLESVLRPTSSPLDITRMKDLVSSIHSLRYLNRLVRNLGEDCRRCDVEIRRADGTIVDVVRGSRTERTKEVAEAIMMPALCAGLSDRCRVNTLLAFRIAQVSSIVASAANSRNVLLSHRRKVNWHVQRLYRMRNAIVHSAFASERSIALLCRNLHSYTNTITSMLVHQLADTGSTNLEQAIQALLDDYTVLMAILEDGPLTPELLVFGVSGMP